MTSDSPEFKANILLAHDLAMLATAVKYNIDNKAQRTQSNKDLVRLFFNLAEIIDIDMFIEAGAKDAWASRRAQTRFPNARVVAFEANPYTYRSFLEVNQSAGIEYLHRALTDKPGPITFNVLRNDAGEPLANGQASILKRDKKGDRDRGYDEVTVDGITLDSYFRDTPFTKAAMWVDVEGACGMVLTGARQVLANTAVLVVEVEDENWWGEGHWMREEVVSYLYDLGLVPVARDFEFIHQYNIVFVRAELLVSPNKLRWALARFASQVYPSAAPPAPKTAPAPAVKPPAKKPAPKPTFKRKVRKQLGRARRATRSLLKR